MTHSNGGVISDSLIAAGVLHDVVEGGIEELISALHDLLILHSKGMVGNHSAGEMLLRKQTENTRASKIRKRRYIFSKLSTLGYPGRILPSLMMFKSSSNKTDLSLCRIDISIAIGWVLLLCKNNENRNHTEEETHPSTVEDIAIEYRRLLRLTSMYKEGLKLLESKRDSLPPRVSANRPNCLLITIGDLIAERQLLWKTSYPQIRQQINHQTDSLPAEQALAALRPALVTLEKPELIHSIRSCWKTFRTSHSSRFQSMRPLLPPVKKKINERLESRSWFYLFLQSSDPKPVKCPPADPTQSIDREVPDCDHVLENSSAIIKDALNDVPIQYQFHG